MDPKRLVELRTLWGEGRLSYDDQEEMLKELETFMMPSLDGMLVEQGGKVVGRLRQIDPPSQSLDLRVKDQLIRDAKSPPMLEYGKVAFPAADFYDESGKLRVDLEGLAAENESMVQGAFERVCSAEFKLANEEADAREARLATGLYDGNEKPGKIHAITCDLDEDCDCG